MLGRLLFAGFILLYFIVPLINGTLELSTDAMLFPWFIGGVGSILVLWDMVEEVKKARRKSSKEAKQRIDFEKVKAFLSGSAWILAILPMIYLIGFAFTIPIYLFLCFKFNGEKWPLSLILSSMAGIIFYFVFVHFLRIPFYGGLLTSFIKG
ncbi:MAG: tripartite tricarboxylate transporter TctB family protein [Thermodesulfobacteriota bacterium]